MDSICVANGAMASSNVVLMLMRRRILIAFVGENHAGLVQLGQSKDEKCMKEAMTCFFTTTPAHSSKSSKVKPQPMHCNAPRTRRSVGDNADLNHLPSASGEALTFNNISLNCARGSRKRHRNFEAQRLLCIVASLSTRLRHQGVMLGGSSFKSPL